MFGSAVLQAHRSEARQARRPSEATRTPVQDRQRESIEAAVRHMAHRVEQQVLADEARPKEVPATSLRGSRACSRGGDTGIALRRWREPGGVK